MSPSKNEKSVVVFSDLDGTVLDKNYGVDEAQAAIQRLKASGARIVLCSSKTRSEIEYYRKELDIIDPFISENGAAIFVSKNYFKQARGCTKENAQYHVTKLGISYASIREAFEEIKTECNCKMTGFGDMTAQQIAENSQLPLDLAKLAKEREFTEPFCMEKGHELQVLEAAQRRNLSLVSGGRYWHLIGRHNKGSAVVILKKMFESELGDLYTIGVGDHENDLEMLTTVDKLVMVQEGEIYAAWKTVLRSVLTRGEP